LPTIIDSLFLELGIDTSKFSKDQQQALGKIQQFESQIKRTSSNARGRIKTVGEAFRDLANDSRLGSSAGHFENLADKIKMLGMSMSASGGAGAPLGMMARGLGALLSPLGLGAAAVALVGGEVWDFNKKMTAANATIYRNAQLSNMAGKNMWAWGEAAKTVGGTPEEMQAGISGLQTAVAGMMIGVGNASSQLTGLARLSMYGAKWNPQKGVDIDSLFGATFKMGQSQGWAKTWALVSGYGLMNQTEFNLAMRGPAGVADFKKAQAAAPKSIESILEESLNAQAKLGERQIAADALAEKAYGALQKPMESVVDWLTKIYGVLDSTLGLIGKVVDFLLPKELIKEAKGIAMAIPNALGKMASGVKMLMGLGVPALEAAALVGNQMAESSMDPLARNGSHVGLMQWDKSRQADFAKRFGYQMGSDGVSSDQQFLDQEKFAQIELETTKRAVSKALSKIPSLIGKTFGVMHLDEIVNDDSFNRRLSYAQQAMDSINSAAARSGVVQHNVTSETHIGEVNVHTPSTDPKAHANAVAEGITDHPLINPNAQGVVSLATRGMTG
jgi:hypothetical protein